MFPSPRPLSCVPLYGIERRADSMRRRPPCFAIALVFTLWAFAGLVTLTCACCALMGGTCPGVCASSPSVLSTPSPETSVSVHLVYMQPPSPPASPVVHIPTPPPKPLREIRMHPECHRQITRGSRTCHGPGEQHAPAIMQTAAQTSRGGLPRRAACVASSRGRAPPPDSRTG